MKLKTTRFRELMDLKQVLAVSFLIALYALHLLANHLVFGSAATLPPQGLLIFLVFWTIGAVWVAYRRWMLIGMTERDLDDVLAGINPDVFVVIDPDRKISMCSPAVTRVFGYTPEEVLGRTTDLLYYDRRPVAGNPRGIHDQLERVGFHIGEAKGRLRDGGAIPLEIVTGTIRGRKGAVLLIRDISKRVEIEQAHREKAELLRQLEVQYKQLRESEEQRENLMHMIVHDMKNPLQIILGNMQMLKADQSIRATAEEIAYVDETLIHTRRLSNLVSSILDISRLEAGQMPLRPVPCDLRVAARRALAELQRIVGERPVQLFAPADPVVAHCDADLVHRVLINLISNGIHHTPDTARLDIRLRPGEGIARVEVADNGPGIAPALRARLFANSPAARATRWTGMSRRGWA
jgi:PAS domain S-box-containing protein